MLMSVIELRSEGQVFPELAGARVLITGLTSVAGVDVARSFADHKGRLVIHTPEDSPAMTALGSVLAETAADIRFYNSSIAHTDDAVKLAQSAAQAYGGIDAVVNIVVFSAEDLAGCSSVADIEKVLADRLLPPTLIARVAANRMRLMLSEGSILNVVYCPEPANDRQGALIAVIRATLAAMTKGEARDWAGEGIRVNAIGPRGEPATGAVLESEPDIAFLALYLASRKGRQLSGYLFDTEAHARD